jgi:dienelactone hydrolase
MFKNIGILATFLSILAAGCTRQSIEKSINTVKAAYGEERSESNLDRKKGEEPLPGEMDTKKIEALPAQAAPGRESNQAGPAIADKRYVPGLFPSLGPGVKIDNFVQYQSHITHANGLGTDLWIYVPRTVPQAGQSCLLIPPAGSDLTRGMALSDDDMAEHLPYLDYHFIVVAFSISGRGTGNPLIETKAQKRFIAARGGVENGRTALDYILHYFPRINPDRIFCAGRGSAGTLSLQLASADARIKACVAFAPITHFKPLPDRHPRQPESSGYVEEFLPFLRSSALDQIAPSIKIPVFIFHSNQDEVIPVKQSAAFAEQLSTTNEHVTFKRGSTPGHYDSLFTEGIPEAIVWMVNLPTREDAGQ